jgi:NAD(P)-dependent dehydrogenase (short-subunit alcohol dehydrogenase family)
MVETTNSGLGTVILTFSVVLITGTSINGIGFETARVLAKYANLVIITGYNSERQV